MSFRRALVRLLLALAVALGMIAAPPLAGPASAVEVLADGGFEATVPNTTTNPYWEGFDSEYEEGPLCRSDNYCGNGDFGNATARTGLGWLWFGYGEVAGQTGWARQSVTIPDGRATLSYWYRFGSVQLTVAPGQHVFRVVARDAAGNADTTPAEAAFTAYDCVTLKADVVHDRTKLRALKKKLRKARADLRAAVAADDADEVHRLQKKVHRLEKKRKPARKALKAARAAYAPCLL